MHWKVLYLSSLESEVFALVSEVRWRKLVHFRTGKTAVIADIMPPLEGQDSLHAGDLGVVLLTARHQGDDVSNIKEFPCFVHVARIDDEHVFTEDEIEVDWVDNIAWCDLYRTESDALTHRFDK